MIIIIIRFDYLWISQKSSDEERSVGCLPDRLKAEIAIHVHLNTLKRVDIFQNTEAGFLCELVLRLKPVLFSPGDYVCRKNEVGHEMYIVSRGILEVVTNEGATVVATLKAGSYFGEISVLNVGLAGNKRTASVRSVGYSDLFCLNKQDLWDVLKNYPNAEARIRARAEERLSKLDINSNSNYPNKHNSSSPAGNYLRVPEIGVGVGGGGKSSPAQTGSQSLSGNLSGGSSSRHRRRLCSSGSRHKLVGRNQFETFLGAGGGQLLVADNVNCCSRPKWSALNNEQVPLNCGAGDEVGAHSSCCCGAANYYHQTAPPIASHSNTTAARHLLELNLAGRDERGPPNGLKPSGRSGFNGSSNINLALPDCCATEKPSSSLGGQSRSLDQAAPSAAFTGNHKTSNGAGNNKRQYENNNQSRDGADPEAEADELDHGNADADADERSDRPVEAGGGSTWHRKYRYTGTSRPHERRHSILAC